MKKIKIQMIGSYYVNQLTNRLSGDIIVQNVVNGLSPFTMIGTPDNSLIQVLENKLKDLSQYSEKSSPALYEKQSRCLFDLKKNFSELLSRDENIYCDNIIFQSLGKGIVKCNDAKYIIIDNTSAIYPVIKYNNVLYTDNWSVNPLIDFLRLHNGARFNPSRLEDFNWQYYFDKYIDAILECYDSNRIILIKTSMNDLYFDSEKRSPMFFPETDTVTAKFIQNLDQYFAEKTGCIVVDLLCGRIPNKLEQSGWRYSGSMGNAYNEVADEINRIILENNTNTVENKTSVHYNSPLAKSIYEKVYEPYIGEFSEILRVAESYRASSFERITDKIEKNEEITYLFSLEQFLKKNGFNNLCDYIKSCFNQNYTSLDSSPDFVLIRNYSRFFECDINDILSIYYLYNFCEDKSWFSEIAQNIISKEKGTLINRCSEIVKRNIEFLNAYKYIDQQYINGFIDNEKKYIRVCDNGWIIIEPKSDKPFKFVSDLIKKDFDFNKVLNNGYVCTVEYANALTYSYDYYIEKTRKGDAKKPTFLEFNTVEAFTDSLFYIDYTKLLKNERFIFLISGKAIQVLDYMPTVDITELFDPNLVTVKIRAGLGDQIGRYLIGQMVEKYTNRKVIYADIENEVFNGIEFYKIVKNDINLLSDKLSPALKEDACNIFKNLHYGISKNAVYFCKDDSVYKSRADGCSHFVSLNLKNNVYTCIPYSYYDMTGTVTDIRSHFDFNIKDYIIFPKFKDEYNIKMSNKMLSCDAVVMHIRCGDFITAGWFPGCEFYASKIRRLLKISEYNNLKFFVFSDDILWCKEHEKDLGLSNVGNFEVVYMDGNRGEDSFNDIHLMSLGKVIISSRSSFANIAAMYSERCEIYVASSHIMNLYQKHVRKNKYDIVSNIKDDIKKSSAENEIVQNNAGGGYSW